MHIPGALWALGSRLVQQFTAKHRATVVVSVLIPGIAAVGLLAPNVPIPALAILTPLAYAVAVLVDAGTAILLFATWRTALSPRSIFSLALTYSGSAALIAIALPLLPLTPNGVPIVASPPQASTWIFQLWHVFVAAGFVSYAVQRSKNETALPARSDSVKATLVAGGAVAAIVAFALLYGSHIPLVIGSSVAGLNTTGVGPFTAGLLALATVLAFRLRDPGPVDRAIGFSALALTLETVLFMLGAHRYTSTFYAGRALLLFAEMYVFIAAVRTLVASRTRLAVAEHALVQATSETARQAKRIRAVWEIASQTELSNVERFSAILDIATAAIRPSMPMFGSLSHLDGEELVFDATSFSGRHAHSRALAEGLYPGARVGFHETMQSFLGSDGRATHAWNDLDHLDHLDRRGRLYQRLGLRSFVGTPVAIGRQTYFLTFSSEQSMAHEPFGEDDIAFVDVVAAFFASRFTQQRQFERLQFQIEHDALTGLVNRVQFRKAVREAIALGEAFAVAFVDIDGFRHVNESEGNQIGDEVLVEVAATLSSVSPKTLVARMSADEFGLLIRGTAGIAGATHALKAYAGIFNERFHTGDRNGTQMLNIGASIGAACYPFDGDTAEAIMRRADVALDLSKAGGGSATTIFDGSMEAILAESHHRVVELNAAIALDELALVYQPTFELATRRVTGAEALVRWDHPERGRLPPSEFLPFVEKNGLMPSLSRWVFRRTVRDVSAIADLPPSFRVYFNLAAEMLDDIPFIAEVRAALDADPRLVKRLGIEVTETAAMQNVERSMHTIEMFRQWGLTVAIDDFGTGYSSLSYLKQLTVDVVKIDRSFVMGLPDEGRDGAITEMLLRITDRFGFATLAEGIETEAQAEWLLAHGCRYGQGYLIAKPFSFAELIACLEPVYAGDAMRR